jgi:tetratricopeptide (TPR) repeat protein
MEASPYELAAEAKRLIAERRYEDAVRVTRRALLGRSDDVALHLLLGEALLAQEKYDETRVEMLALTRKHPQEATAHRILGEAFLRSGQMQKAREALEQASVRGDAAAADLLREAEGEAFVPSNTIERWFGHDEPKTIEQELPPWSEEDTPPPRALPAGAAESKIEIDPAFAREASLATEKNAPKLEADVESTQPMQRPPELMLAPPEGLKALLAKAKPAESSKPVLVAPAAVIAVTKTPSRTSETSVARPAGKPSPWQKSAPPPASAPPGLKRTTLQGTTSPLVPKPLVGVRPSDPTKSAAAASAFGASTRKRPTLQGAPSPFAPRSPTLEDDPADLLRTNERRVDSERTDERPSPPERDHDLTGIAESPRRAPPAPPSRKPTLVGVTGPPIAPPPSARPPAPRAPAFEALGSGPLPPTEPELTAPRPRAAPAETVLVPHPAPMPSPIAPRVAPPQEEVQTDPHRRQRGASTGDTARVRRPVPRQAAILGASALVAVLVVGTAVLWVSARRNEQAIAADLERASDEGSRTDLVDALARLDGERTPDAIALRARLVATRAVEMGIGDPTEADAELSSLDTAGGALLDARIARALVVLSHGEADQAATLLSGVQGSGVTLAEALHVQSLSLEALGQLADARTAATQAAALRPAAPRHAALVARIALALGDVQGAATALAIPDAERSPLVRLVRGRIALAAGDAVTAAGEATQVLGPLVSLATPHDVAAAQVLRARAAILVGDRATAVAALDAADPLRRASDEVTALDVAEGYLDAGANDQAARVIATLPRETASPARRASVVVRSALAHADYVTADAMLPLLGAGPRADLLRAAVRDAQGRGDEARLLYERAAADPALAVEARAREGELFLRLGRPADARAAVETTLRATPSDAHLADLFVRAALALGDRSAANAALGPALAAHPDSLPLRAAHGRVLLAQGHATEAVAELGAVAAATPNDRELREALGAAAFASGDRATAITAYEAALQLAPTASAHLGLAAVLADDARFDEALTHIASADGLGGAGTPASARARARLDVVRGLGASAFATVRVASDASSRDADLWADRAALEAQAEAFRDADDSVSHALRIDANHPEALLVRAALSIEDGDLGGAGRAIDRAERNAAVRALPPSFAARAATLRGRLRFEAGDEAGATRFAQQAVTLDAHCGIAHLLLADVAIASHADPVPELRLAAAGTSAPPEAAGRLAMRLASGADACTFAHAYVDRAPTGYDRDEVDEVLRRCR